nr:shikimate dehydrogenase [Sneathiella limimaris]
MVGLVGKGIQLSRTPSMHEAEAKAQGIKLKYQLIDTDLMADPETPFERILEEAEEAGFVGLNVTYPYKKEAKQCLHSCSDAANAIGAVNTIILKEGERYGHNTDYWGFAESMKQGLPDVSLDCVLLIGAGGAGAAIANAMIDLGVKELLIADTNETAASSLQQQLQLKTETPIRIVRDLESAATKSSGIINATPVGMAKLPGCPIPKHILQPHHWVSEIIYFPLQTEFLQAAEAVGCQSLPGSGMAVYQAVRAFKLFTGKEPDAGRMRETFESFTKTSAM